MLVAQRFAGRCTLLTHDGAETRNRSALAYRFSTLSALIAALLAMTGCRQCGNEITAPEATRTTLQEGAAPIGATTPTPVNAPPTATAPSTGRPNDRSPLGTNLSGIADWSTEIPFIDLFRMSRELTSGSAQAWADGRKLDCDPHGWLKSLAPGQEARTVMLNGSRFRDGRYVVLYEGRGEYRYAGSARLDGAASRPGRDVLSLERARGDTGITMDFSSIASGDPMRNIRVVPPGGACEVDRARFCDPEHPCASGACLTFAEHHDELIFHPDFLASIQRYGMIRFMDWTQTNNSEVVSWEQRGKVENQTWATRGGVPFEIMVKLANQLGAQPWFTIPHQANDDYVRKLAELLKATVDPNLPIWVEWSNEVWNPMFQQYLYARRRAVELGYSDDFQGSLRFQAKRSLEVFKIFEGVLGKERVKTVLGSQAGNTWVSTELLDYDGMAGHVDALAIAPYFGWIAQPDELPKVRAMSVDQLIARTRDVMVPETKKWLADQGAVAKAHHVELVAYEAGQHFVGAGGAENDEQLNKLFDAVNRDPRMKELYTTYLDNWKASGGTWLNHFNNCDAWSKWGRWGALENMQQPRAEAPKFDALMTFIEKNPRWW